MTTRFILSEFIPIVILAIGVSITWFYDRENFILILFVAWILLQHTRLREALSEDARELAVLRSDHRLVVGVTKLLAIVGIIAVVQFGRSSGGVFDLSAYFDPSVTSAEKSGRAEFSPAEEGSPGTGDGKPDFVVDDSSTIDAVVVEDAPSAETRWGEEEVPIEPPVVLDRNPTTDFSPSDPDGSDMASRGDLRPNNLENPVDSAEDADDEVADSPISDLRLEID